MSNTIIYSLVVIYTREHPLMMSDFRGGGPDEGSEKTPKYQTLEDKNWTSGGWGSKIFKNRRTSLMDVPQGNEKTCNNACSDTVTITNE